MKSTKKGKKNKALKKDNLSKASGGMSAHLLGGGITQQQVNDVLNNMKKNKQDNN